MAHVDLIQYEQASEDVKEVFDDIKNLRKIPDVITPANKTLNYEIKSLYCEHGKNRYPATL